MRHDQSGKMSSKNLPIIDWLQIQSSAPGKLIVSGEYSVVYEKSAIAAAIDDSTKVTIKPNNDGKVRLSLRNFNDVWEWSIRSLPMCKLVEKYNECLEFDEAMKLKLYPQLHKRFLISSQNRQAQSGESPNENDKALDSKTEDAAMAFLLLYVGIGDSYCSSGRPAIDVEVDSTLPVGSGLGSSSAYAVSLCGALMRVFRVVAEKYIISNWAFQIDKFFHGRPSGIDNSIITNGGYLLFHNGKIKAPGIQHNRPIKVMLVDTGVSRSTRELSKVVNGQMRNEFEKITRIFNSINDITTHIWRKINDPEFIPKDIRIFLETNQQLLNEIGVGHEKINDICMRANKYDLAAKLTGAGGGGTAFVLYDDSDNEAVSKLRTELQSVGYKVHDHMFGCEGLSVKIIPDPSNQFVLGNNR